MKEKQLIYEDLDDEKVKEKIFEKTFEERVEYFLNYAGMQDEYTQKFLLNIKNSDPTLSEEDYTVLYNNFIDFSNFYFDYQ